MVAVTPNMRKPLIRWKRETHGDKAVASAGTGHVTSSTDSTKSGLQKFEDKIGITELASKTGMTHWQVRKMSFRSIKRSFN
jgi:hypothetical protein